MQVIDMEVDDLGLPSYVGGKLLKKLVPTYDILE